MSRSLLDSEPKVYAPISVLAVVSLIVAGLFAVTLLVLGGLAFYSSTPMLLGTGMIIVPLVACVLALLALRQIKASEGTRTGANLASAALVLSVLFGGGYYLAYLFPLYKAVSIQADTFATDWLDKIRAGKINAAFLDTLEPGQRGDDPNDERLMQMRHGTTGVGRKGPLTAFHERDLVEILSQAGPDAELVNLGVRSWGYEKGGYHVEEVYRLITPEGTFDLLITMFRIDRNNQRTWRIAFTPEATRLLHQNLSKRGLALRRWHAGAQQFAATWLEERNRGNRPTVYLLTRPPAERKKLEWAYQAQNLANVFARVGVAQQQLTGGALALALLGDSNLNVAGYLPGYRKFGPGSVIDKTKLQVDPKLEPFVLGPGRLLEGTGFAAIGDDKIRVWFEVQLNIYPSRLPPRQPPYQCIARLYLVSNKGLSDLTGPPEWHVEKLELLRAGAPAAEDGPGGMPPR